MITLFIGDNGSGKTKVLSELIKQVNDDNLDVITNIGYTEIDYPVDEAKLALFKTLESDLIDSISDGYPATLHTTYYNKMLKYLYSKGNILVLDNLDAKFGSQDFIDYCACISEMDELWDDIYVSSYHIHSIRMFEKYDNMNIFFVNNFNNIEKLDDDEIDEYFDKIR